MSKRLPGALALALVVGSLAVACAWASDESSMLRRTARASRNHVVIGPEPAPLPVASPATPGDDDMPERSGRGPKSPGESGSSAESPRASRWMEWVSALRARWIEFVQR
jgi:hypothetical protein